MSKLTQASHYPHPTNCDEFPKRKPLHWPNTGQYKLQVIGVTFRVWVSYNATDGENCKAQAIMKAVDQKTLIQVCKEPRRDGNIPGAVQ